MLRQEQTLNAINLCAKDITDCWIKNRCTYMFYDKRKT